MTWEWVAVILIIAAMLVAVAWINRDKPPRWKP